MADTVRAKQGFRLAGKKGQRGDLVHAGQVFDASDKIVKKYSNMFVPVEPTPQKVFTATAAPGEPQGKRTDVSDYHVGGGWYQIGDEKVQGEKAARELLES